MLLQLKRVVAVDVEERRELKMLLKKSISVYNPQDPLEDSLQTAYHKYNNGWMTSFECQLAAKAIASLKSENDWIYEKKLLNTRANYFFSPEMCGDSSETIFVCHPISLRDILENRRISSYLNEPVVFVSKPIAYYLLKEYPLHIIVDLHLINSSEIFNLGGLWISENRIDLPINAIKGIKINDNVNRESIVQMIDRISQETNMIMHKVAVTNLGKGVFGLERGIDLDIVANEPVQNKVTKKFGTVYSVEPGDNGCIFVLYNNGENEVFTKSEFVHNFIYNFRKK